MQDNNPGSKPKKHWLSLTDLIAAGILRPGQKLEAEYKGSKFTATLLEDGTVRFRRRAHAARRRGQTPLSRIAGLAMREVRGEAQSRGIPAVDGWLFWKFRDAHGRLRPLSEARQVYIAENR